MKKLISFLGLLMLILTSTIFTSCEKDPVIPDVPGEPIEFKGFKSDSGIIVNDEQIQIVGSGLEKDANEFIYYDLKDYVGKTIEIDFSCKMKTSSSTGVNLMWQILDKENDYPIIAMSNVSNNWIELSGSRKFIVEDGFLFYLSTYQLDFSNLNIDIKDIKFNITIPKPKNPEDEWMKVPSLKEVYEDIFDSFGIACEYGWDDGVELYYDNVQKGLAKHADSITLGNELKPQFMFKGNIKSGGLVDFPASNGLTIKVPAKIDGLDRLDKILTILKNNNLKMRGHVLTWHSQTPDEFFAKDYSAKYNGDLISNLVSKDEMTARHEWYIKTILDFVNEWEAKNGYGEGNHIIWSWDVVNEAVADDDSTGTNYLRGATSGTKNKKPDNGGSRWYQIYGNDEFIINAFRFANAYAPADVSLAYNDYNEYMDYNGGRKKTGILNLIKRIKNGDAKTVNGKSVKPRIDVMGMQSHVGDDWITLDSYETSVTDYLAAGVDVHITEFDVKKYSQEDATKIYSDYFNMLKKYGKKYSGENKVINVTVWGINNENSWINKDGSTYPLLFSKENNEYYANDSFYAVIDAVK